MIRGHGVAELADIKRENFVQAYLLNGGKGMEAAISAGITPKAAASRAHLWLDREDVQARLAELRAPITAARAAKLAEVMARAEAIATTDAGELVRYRIGCCRYCWGVDHLYRWKTEREFKVALFAARAKLDEGEQDPVDDPSWPSDAGGFGYRLSKPPNEDCPECDGMGIPYVEATDTTRLSKSAAALYAGAKHGQNGIEIMMQDRSKHLEMLAKHHGAFSDAAAEARDTITDFIIELAHRAESAAQLRRENTQNALPRPSAPSRSKQ